MTSVSPPTYYFPGITFNSAFYTTSSSGGLTQAQANALYLKKNTADTATALETFNGGVITNSIDTSTLASDMTIGKSTNTGTLTIGTIGAMNLGVVSAPLNTQKTVSINGTDPTGGRQYITNISTFKFRSGTGFNEFNLIDQYTTNYFAIGDRQDTGELRIGGGASVPRSGAITIGTNASNTCNVNISNAPGTALLPTTGQVNIASGSGVLSSYTVTTNIGAGSTTGAVTIGNTSNTTSILSGTTNINTGVGTSLVPLVGTVNIATGTGAGFVSTAVNIGTGDTTGAITIGSASATATVGIRNPRMTLSYTAVPTLTSSQIGYTTSVYAPNTAGGTALVTTGAQTAFLSIASVPIGLWLVNYATRITGTGVASTVTKYQTWINITNQGATIPYAYGPSGFGNLSMPVGAYNSGMLESIATNGSGVIKTLTSTGTISLTYMAVSSPTNTISFWNDGVTQPASTFLTITRIG